MMGVIRAGFNIFITLIALWYLQEPVRPITPVWWVVFAGFTFIITNWTKDQYATVTIEGVELLEADHG